MTETAKRAICVGEATIELARWRAMAALRWPSSGDTFTTAIYLARAGRRSLSPARWATIIVPTPIVSLAA